jgi:hypothetical protein
MYRKLQLPFPEEIHHILILTEFPWIHSAAAQPLTVASYVKDYLRIKAHGLVIFTVAECETLQAHEGSCARNITVVDCVRGCRPM